MHKATQFTSHFVNWTWFLINLKKMIIKYFYSSNTNIRITVLWLSYLSYHIIPVHEQEATKPVLNLSLSISDSFISMSVPLTSANQWQPGTATSPQWLRMSANQRDLQPSHMLPQLEVSWFTSTLTSWSPPTIELSASPDPINMALAFIPKTVFCKHVALLHLTGNKFSYLIF